MDVSMDFSMENAKYGQFMSFSMEKSMETSIFDGKNMGKS
jgi:hypothetical protein